MFHRKRSEWMVWWRRGHFQHDFWVPRSAVYIFFSSSRSPSPSQSRCLFIVHLRRGSKTLPGLFIESAEEGIFRPAVEFPISILRLSLSACLFFFSKQVSQRELNQIHEVLSVLTDLPHEIVCEVFSHLSPLDACQICLVSTLFERLSNHSSVWKTICIRELDLKEKDVCSVRSFDWKLYYREKRAFTSSFAVRSCFVIIYFAFPPDEHSGNQFLWEKGIAGGM